MADSEDVFYGQKHSGKPCFPQTPATRGCAPTTFRHRKTVKHFLRQAYFATTPSAGLCGALLIALLTLCPATEAAAIRVAPLPAMLQNDSAATKFKITGCKTLPNDVSAFIAPVRDLNGDACALLKVVAPEEFAFSTPLGIVKRVNEVGEIWLYLPHGTKLLTIKHPLWGVWRDYRFARPLESHVTYELKIETPAPEPAYTRDTVFFTKTVTDTVIVDQRKPKLPWQLHGLLTASWHERGPSWGVMLTLFRRHGFFVHGQSDLRRTGPTPQTCDREGFLPGSAVKPYYTGKTRQSSYAVTAGMTHRLRPWLSVFYGAGYGRSAVAWQLAESEGGGYVLNGGLSRKGMAAEAGLVFSVKRVSLAASTLTVAGRQWQIGIGVGIRLGNQKE